MAAGATEVERLVVRILGDGSQYIKTINTVVNRTQAAATRMKMAGLKMSAAFTLPLSIIGGASVKAFANFDKAMIESTSIMGNLSNETKKRMREVATELSKRSVQGPTDLAKSYFYLASAGLDAEQSMAALPAVSRFATAGAFDMSKATDLLTDAQSALGLTSKDAAENLTNMTRLSDVLVKANTLANASVEQFSTALTTKAGAAMRAYGKDAEEGVAVLAAFADQGIKSELAGNALDRFLRLLSTSALDNAEAHKKLGFSVFDSTGAMRNMADIVENLETVLHGLSTEQKVATLTALGFEARVQQVVLPLLGTSKAIRRYEAGLRSAGGTTDDVASKQMKAFSNQLSILWNKITILAMGIGQTLAPMIEKLSEYLQKAIDYWDWLSESTRKTIVYFGVFVAAIGPVLTGIGVALSLFAGAAAAMVVLAKAIAFVLSPIGLLLAAVIAIVVWLGKAIISTQMFQDVWNTLTGGIITEGIVDAIKAGDIELAWKIVTKTLEVAWNELTFKLKESWIGFTGFFSEAFLSVVAMLQKAWISFKEFIVSALLGGFDLILKGWQFVLDTFSDAFKSLSKGLEDLSEYIPGLGPEITLTKNIADSFGTASSKVGEFRDQGAYAAQENAANAARQRAGVDSRLAEQIGTSREISNQKLSGLRANTERAQKELNGLNQQAADKLLKQQAEKFGDDVLVPWIKGIGDKVASAFTTVQGSGAGGDAAGVVKDTLDRSAGTLTGATAGSTEALAAISRQSSLFAAGGGAGPTEADPKADTQNLDLIKTNTTEMTTYLSQMASAFSNLVPAGLGNS